MNMMNKHLEALEDQKSTKMQCGYLYGWPKKRLHTQKSNPKNGELAGNAKEEKEKGGGSKIEKVLLDC